MIRVVSAAALAAVLFVSAESAPSWAQSTPAEAVKARQALMKSLFPDYYRDMARLVRGENTDFAAASVKATQATQALQKVVPLFAAGTGHDVVPDSRAKPDIWTHKAEFDAAVATLIAETKAFGDVAKTGNMDAIKAQWTKVAKACGECHGGPSKSGGKFRFEKE